MIWRRFLVMIHQLKQLVKTALPTSWTSLQSVYAHHCSTFDCIHWVPTDPRWEAYAVDKSIFCFELVWKRLPSLNLDFMIVCMPSSGLIFLISRKIEQNDKRYLIDREWNLMKHPWTREMTGSWLIITHDKVVRLVVEAVVWISCNQASKDAETIYNI